MNDQLWSWVLGFIGVAGFILAGKKIWWAWYVNIGCQFLWFAYAIVTQQWGFFLSSIVYLAVFSKNAYDWTKERRAIRVAANDFVDARLDSIEKLIARVNEGVITEDEARLRIQDYFAREIKVPDEFNKLDGDVS